MSPAFGALPAVAVLLLCSSFYQICPCEPGMQRKSLKWIYNPQCLSDDPEQVSSTGKGVGKRGGVVNRDARSGIVYVIRKSWACEFGWREDTREECMCYSFDAPVLYFFYLFFAFLVPALSSRRLTSMVWSHGVPCPVVCCWNWPIGGMASHQRTGRRGIWVVVNQACWGSGRAAVSQSSSATSVTGSPSFSCSSHRNLVILFLLLAL